MIRNSVKILLIAAIAIYWVFVAIPLHAKTYTVGVVEWEPWATAYVAAEKGFWKSEGIHVTVKQFDDYMGGSVKAFKFGKIDFGIMMLGNAVDLIRKAPRYTIIYEHDWSHGGDLFILSGKLDSIGDLKGKRIGVYSTAAPIGFFLDKVLQNAHLKIKDVELIEVSNTSKLNKSFRNGVVSAVVSYDPEASKVVGDGTGKLMFTSADFPGVIPEGIVVQNRILKDDPADVEKFLRGWLRAVKWQSDPANLEAYFAILKRTMFKGTAYSSQDIEKLTMGGKIHGTLGEITEKNEREIHEYIKELLAYLKESGARIKSFKPRDYTATDIAVKEAKKIF
ncbi:MAG: ABC transporter substrate-binding protein [Deltaproteobacteria bacterium]|jgi:NitT/TauT family transport system substrate-binding protein|nr:ABC transporter substrate-binding protein [Deltaproteobacteria bacterium]